MSVSAGEIERAESRAKAKAPRQCAEEYRLEAVEYYRRAREADPKKSIRECAAELGINDKTLNDWVIKFGSAFSQVKVDSSLCRFPTLRSGHARTPSFRYQRA